ncbi:hypothetical protein BO70DRAFT_118192 [Aspergillus heteromorphus CBS 117.55]|uniref:Uncharacterized protein n=1 Tax=Aspergillus heteromorphus CBS 117.55 TaxID=1448321 RepID=A0A317VKE1_9EURO|nr:uncharacterized protein BO70DRAFT_118192 [Aspergillus heteromorphus CBS 117.55]PWY72400.1 hypothetical protein BO70DRAFT_118192 [Aspergillus heteromorphus CBS 117.55]
MSVCTYRSVQPGRLHISTRRTPPSSTPLSVRKYVCLSETYRLLDYYHHYYYCYCYHYYNHHHHLLPTTHTLPPSSSSSTSIHLHPLIRLLPPGDLN